MVTYELAINPCVYEMGSHDPSAVLFEGGDIVYGVEEERFTREKHAADTFPERAIRACLDRENLRLSDVDRVLVPWEPALFAKSLPYNVGQSVTQPKSVPEKIQRTEWAIKHSVVPFVYAKRGIAQRLEKIGSPVPVIETFEHHECHAASAFYPSPFDDAVVVTVDGRGEDDSTVVWRGDEDGVHRLRTYEYPNSLGFFFGAVTRFLGYRPNNGEGKIMGLAPYGDDNAEIESRLREVIDTGLDYDVTELSKGDFEYGTQRLESLFGRSRKSHTREFTRWEKDLAYVVQKLVEETVADIVEHYCVREDIHDVCLAGGVALNCKMNKRVMELDAVDDLFVQPVSNDAGSALGAGMLSAGPHGTSEMDTVYWGPDYSTAEIRSLLETNKIDYSHVEDAERYVAEKIADGELVGWFHGRLEMGPRALGNRSILADPRSQESLDRVNRFVKHREGWRPFAPSMTEEASEEYLVDGERAPYMIKTFDVKEEKKEEIPAVLHPADGTTRPQTVNQSQNPRYYRLLKRFEDITGVPVLLNTSFNDNGEPIVTDPREAVKDFYGMGLDVLVLEDLVIEKGSHRRESFEDRIIEEEANL